jgi:tRNA(fMet)-specific endonuclease VapC
MVSWLLDTNCLIYVLENRHEGEILLKEKKLYVPSPAIGELYFGARKSARIEWNLERVRVFITRFVILPCDHETAEFYGEIKAALKRKGKPIPDNDIWIAAIASQHNLSIVTRDRHFNEVDGINLVSW